MPETDGEKSESESPSRQFMWPPNIDQSIVSSTRISEEKPDFLSSKDRRKTMIPLQPSGIIDNSTISKTDSDSLGTTKQVSKEEKPDINSQKNHVRFNLKDDDETEQPSANIFADSVSKETPNQINALGGCKQGEKLTNKEVIQKDENTDSMKKDMSKVENINDDFDVFILQNIVPYNGKDDVISWLDSSEAIFNRNRISRNLRFESISLILTGVAKQAYMKHRHQIRTYDDFYEFLLFEFGHTNATFNSDNSCQTTTNQHRTLFTLSQKNSMCDSFRSNNSSSNENESIPFTHQSALSYSTKKTDNDVTESFGEKSVNIISTSFDNSVTPVDDPTLKDLRKAIVEDLIKNPKVFKGGKEDVTKWLETIEHLFEVAQIPGHTRLNLISYSLRGDALEWFKNNKASIKSWNAFVTEIKRAFTSFYYSELAFKKLESYTQGENQSIRNFYNDVLKLCREADPAMSEATKLKNLLSKTKSSIQLEVRKKKPMSITEYLDFAKEAEELIELSNLSNDSISDDNTVRNFSQKSKPSFPSKPNFNFNRTWNRSSNSSFSRYSRNTPDNDRHQSNASAYANRNDLSFSTNNQTPQNPITSNQYAPQYTSQRSSNTADSKNNQKSQLSRNTVSKPLTAPQKSANTIDTLQSNIEDTSETVSSATCNRCGEFGHEPSVCPNF